MNSRNNILLDIKRRLQNYKFYSMASEIRQVFQRHLKQTDQPDRKVISFKAQKNSHGNALLSIWNEPFIAKSVESGSESYHSHYWESLEMVRTFLNFGYCVDVIHYKNTTFTPDKDYSVLVDERWNLERLAPALPKQCVKIMHLDTAHMLFHNAAECRRLLELQQRRKVTLRPRRFETPNLGLEHADYATVIGNEFTLSTYRFANKPLFRVPLSTPIVYPWPDGKDFDTCRNRFMWFGSGGMVHKGLDLVLEAFAEMPGYQLTVCGPVQEEKDFEEAFYKELYQTPNIKTVGWVNIASREFSEITKSCVGLIYPSCSEGQAGSVVTALHAGVLPIISYESGVDVDDFGVILRECSVKEIKSSVEMISALPADDLEKMARRAWECARANYTAEQFGEKYRQLLEHIATEPLSCPNQVSPGLLMPEA